MFNNVNVCRFAQFLLDLGILDQIVPRLFHSCHPFIQNFKIFIGRSKLLLYPSNETIFGKDKDFKQNKKHIITTTNMHAVKKKINSTYLSQNPHEKGFSPVCLKL